MYKFFNKVKTAYYSFDPNFNAKPNDSFISRVGELHALPRIGDKYAPDTHYYEMHVRIYLDDVAQEITFEASLCRFLELDGAPPTHTRYLVRHKERNFEISYKEFQENIPAINDIFSDVFQEKLLHLKVGCSNIEMIYQYGEPRVFNVTDGTCKEVFEHIKYMKILVINNSNKTNPILIDDIDDIYGPEKFPNDENMEQFSSSMSL